MNIDYLKKNFTSTKIPLGQIGPGPPTLVGNGGQNGQDLALVKFTPPRPAAATSGSAVANRRGRQSDLVVDHDRRRRIGPDLTTVGLGGQILAVGHGRRPL